MDHPPLSELKFEVALAELEDIVRTMETGALDLDDAIGAYQRGSALLNHCRQQLATAEEQIRILDNGEIKLFAPDSGRAS